jgi:hypothetical protein
MVMHALHRRRSWRAVPPAVVTLTAFLALSSACAGSAGQSSAAIEPWTAANAVTPADLARELSTAPGDKPVVVYTGPLFLYRTGHVPGAVAHGPASEPEALAGLKAWAEGLPRSTNLVVYCGCCPLEACPNLRPSFAALRAMGFTRLRALMLPDSFGRDWIEKGFPVER